MNFTRNTASLLLAGAMALTLVACGENITGTSEDASAKINPNWSGSTRTVDQTTPPPDGSGSTTPTTETPTTQTPTTPTTQPTTGTTTTSPYYALEQQVHAQINAYRATKGLPALTFNETIASEARKHSVYQASVGTISHTGFYDRAYAIMETIPLYSAAENVAYNRGYSDPVTTAVQGWIRSDGHRRNIEGSYNLTGVGIARRADGAYYFTQIFVRAR